MTLFYWVILGYFSKFDANRLRETVAHGQKCLAKLAGRLL
jgi:hypothetical protein